MRFDFEGNFVSQQNQVFVFDQGAGGEGEITPTDTWTTYRKRRKRALIALDQQGEGEL